MSEGLVCEDIVSDRTRILNIFHHRAEIGVPKGLVCEDTEAFTDLGYTMGYFNGLDDDVSTVYQVISHNKWKGRIRVEIS